MTIKNGGPAFPCDTILARDEFGRIQGREISSVGMTLRDFFAGAALSGVCAWSVDRNMLNKHIATEAYSLADAMLEARAA